MKIKKAHSRIKNNQKGNSTKNVFVLFCLWFFSLIKKFFLKRKERIWLLFINVFLFFYFYYIFNNFYPYQIRDVFLNNSYVLILIPGFLFIFNLLFFLMKFFWLDFFFSVFLIFNFYLILQRFIFNQELYIVIFTLFVIIGLLLLVLKILKNAYFTKKTKQKRRRRITR